jgi:hypothetical protein
VPTASDAFMTMMTGTMWQERAKQAQDAIVERTRERAREETMRRRRSLRDDDDEDLPSRD